jgi:hypothetical protein
MKIGTGTNELLCLVAAAFALAASAPVLAQEASQGGAKPSGASARPGKLTYDSGVYEAQIKDGVPDGYGVYVFKSGNRYEGQFRNGVKEGRGKFAWAASGNRCDGEWKADNRTGKGVFVWANGDRYEGQWLDNKSSGYGVQTWANGDRYEGQWQDDKANGQGTKTSSDGRVYSGAWNNGCFRQGDRWSTAGASRADCGL